MHGMARRMGEHHSMDDEAGRDPLTGLPRIGGVLSHIGRWQAEALAQGGVAPVHAMLIGLRRFDTVNLAYGEAVGDAALVEIAARIQQFADEEGEGGWLVARVAGGSFLLAAREPCSRERWQWLAESLAPALSEPIPGGEGGAHIRLWPRIALMRVVPDEAPQPMLGRLAEALGVLQQEAGRRFAWVDGERILPGRSSADLEADLLTALQREEIEILFQPQFRCADDRLIGAEALARWQHPRLGRVGAAALFAIAERTDHVPQLSRHIAQRALAEATRWSAGLRLSLNVTAADLASHAFAAGITELLGQTGFAPDRLTLEITEQVLLGDLERSSRALAWLAERGIKLALDDFGAGFCNFRYLKLLPLHYLKLDRSMVEGIAEDARDLAVLRGIVAMARALDLEVTAEGVETAAQCEAITREGCHAYQGYLRARPMNAARFLDLARGKSSS